jgi:hypothetical protein
MLLVARRAMNFMSFFEKKVSQALKKQAMNHMNEFLFAFQLAD